MATAIHEGVWKYTFIVHPFPSHFLQRKLDPKEVQMIESSVLDKCIRHGGVIHIKVDKRSPYVSV